MVIDARYGWSRELKIAAPKIWLRPRRRWNIQYRTTRGRAAGGGKRACDGGPFSKWMQWTERWTGVERMKGRRVTEMRFNLNEPACENIGCVSRLPAVSAILSTVPRNGNSRLGFKCFYAATCMRGLYESGRSVWARQRGQRWSFHGFNWLWDKVHCLFSGEKCNFSWYFYPTASALNCIIHPEFFSISGHLETIAS